MNKITLLRIRGTSFLFFVNIMGKMSHRGVSWQPSGRLQETKDSGKCGRRCSIEGGNVERVLDSCGAAARYTYSGRMKRK